MIRVVLDANIFISGLLSNTGPPGKILNAWLTHAYMLFISQPIYEEIERVLHYPRISERLDSNLVRQFLKLLTTNCAWTPSSIKLEILTKDPSDNIYLACAVEAQANYLVTGNLYHFVEAGIQFKGVQIVTPRAFLTILLDQNRDIL